MMKKLLVWGGTIKIREHFCCFLFWLPSSFCFLLRLGMTHSFIYLFIHLFNKYLLTIFKIQGEGNTQMNKDVDLADEGRTGSLV